MNIIGIDVGYSSVKAVATVNGEPRQALFPSVVGPAARQSYSVAAAQEFSLAGHDGRRWYIGESAMRESLYQTSARDPGWIERDEYRVLVDAALSELYHGNGEAVVVTGLPVSHYVEWWPRLKTAIEGSHEFQRDGRGRQAVVVTKCAVAMQGLGAVLDRAIDDAGTLRQNVWSGGRVVVVDLGGVTANVLTADRLATAGNWSTSDGFGLLKALDAVAAEIRARYPGISPQAREVADWINRGQFLYRGDPYPVAALARPHLDVVAAAVVARLGELAPEPGRLDALLLSGGGALLLGDRIQELLPDVYPPVTVAADVLGNARGYRKLGLYLQKAGKL